MLKNNSHAAAGVAAATPLRVARITLRNHQNPRAVSTAAPPKTSGVTRSVVAALLGVLHADHNLRPRGEEEAVPALMWRALDLCAAAEQRCAHTRLGRMNIPAALAVIDLSLNVEQQPIKISVLGPLTTNYPVLIRSLQVLRITGNDYDENSALGAFATLASDLRELSFQHCENLTSVRGLEGRCEYLRKINFFGCKHLRSLAGLQDRVCLEEVDVSCTAIASIEPLETCPALTKVALHRCQQLSSMEALADHQWLREVDASNTLVTSVEPLLTCPALTKVDLCWCPHLSENVNLPSSINVIQYGSGAFSQQAALFNRVAR